MDGGIAHWSFHEDTWLPYTMETGSHKEGGSVGSHTALLPLHSFVEFVRPTHPQWEESQTLPFNGKAT